MSEMKPTPGPWTVDGENAIEPYVMSGEFFVAQCFGFEDGGEALDNARLIAEAGTVHHETGLTPRQLVERVKELEGALSAYESARAGLFSHTLSNGVFNAWGKAHDCRALNDAHLQARAALSKSLPNTVAETPK